MPAEKLSPLSVQEEKCTSVIVILYLYYLNTSLSTKIRRGENMPLVFRLSKELFK